MSKAVRPAVEVCDVSIRYKRGDVKQIGLKEYIMRKLTGKLRVTDFWADRHITFSLMPGEQKTVTWELVVGAKDDVVDVNAYTL